DSIYVYNGSYTENVNVNKQLTLTGEGTDVVNITSSTAEHHVFNVSADYVNISGFNVTGATGNMKAGIYIGNGVGHCNISDNTASDNYIGIYLNSSSSDNLFANNTISDNTWDLHIKSSASSFTNNTLNDTTINFIYHGDVSLKGVDLPAGDPAGWYNITKFINATNQSAGAWLYLNFTYSDSDVSDLDESSLKVWKYNGTAWIEDGWNGSRYLDTTSNIVGVNITTFSIFAPLRGTGTGTIPPDPTNLQSTTGNYWVNYTWSAGTGNVTDSYNVSVNGKWANGTIDPYLNTTNLCQGLSVSITIYAFNNTGPGCLSETAASDQQSVGGALSWADGNYSYRTLICVRNITTGNYQLNISIHSGSGTNNNSDIFLNNHNETADFSDIRFYNVSGTALGYWIEDNTADPIKVWYNTTENGTVQLYYGNSDASSESNGDATFEFFDDFETYTTGAIGGQGGWSILRIGGGTGYANVAIKNDRKHLCMYSTDYGTSVAKAFNSANNSILEARAFAEDSTQSYTMGFGNGAHDSWGLMTAGYETTWFGWYGQPTSSRIRRWAPEFALATLSPDSATNNTYYNFKFVWNGSNLEAYRDNVEKLNATDATYSSQSHVHLRVWDSAIWDTDWVFARKYALPEPNVTIGTEETPGAVSLNITISSPQNNSCTNDNTTTFSGTTNKAANITYSVDGSVNETACNNCTSFSNTTTELSEGSHNITVYGVAYGNATDTDSETVYFTVDTTAPNTTLTSPAPNYFNNTPAPVNVTFVCNATDNFDLDRISLYITNASNQSFGLNQTTLVSGTSGSANWTLSLNSGNYTWNCVAYDAAGNSDWGDSNWTVKINSTPPAITIDAPTESAPVYRKGGEQFYVNFSYTEDNPKNYTVTIYNATATINSLSATAYTPNSYVNASFSLNSSAAKGKYKVSVEMYDNDSNYNISYQNESVIKMGWSNVTWNSPSGGYTVGEMLTLTCLVRDANTSSGIVNYPVRFYNKTDSTVTYLGLNYTNSSGYAVQNWDTTGVAVGWYYPKGNITDNTTLFYNVTADDEANTSIELSYATTLEIKNQTNATVISSINFSGATGATVTDPYNNVDGSGSPQNISSNSPVVTIYNPSSSADYKIWLKVEDTSGWSTIISDEKFNVTADDTSPGAVSSWTTLTSWGDYRDTGETVAVGTHKDLYLAYELKGSGTGTSTVSVLGEAV
ncbi:CASH domain-dontaining protein, partial [Candidatus Methanophagaceae archaeon]